MLRSGRRRRAATPETEESAAKEVQAVVWHPVSVAISEGKGIFKHWALFVEDEQDVRKSFIVQVHGSAGRFRYEQRNIDADEPQRFLELIKVGHVPEDSLRRFGEISSNVEVKNQDMTWNCQDFVWNALEALVSAELIDAKDKIYRAGRDMVWDRMEGLA